MANGTDYDQGKQDGAIVQQLKDISAHLIGVREDMKGQETRIRALENWKYWVIGSSVAVGLGAAKFASAFFL